MSSKHGIRVVKPDLLSVMLYAITIARLALVRSSATLEAEVAAGVRLGVGEQQPY